MWFGIFSAATGICHKEFALAFTTRFVHMSLVGTDARQAWRPEAVAKLRVWIGIAWEEWMLPHGGLMVGSAYVEEEVRACAVGAVSAAGPCASQSRNGHRF